MQKIKNAISHMKKARMSRIGGPGGGMSTPEDSAQSLRFQEHTIARGISGCLWRCGNPRKKKYTSQYEGANLGPMVHACRLAIILAEL